MPIFDRPNIIVTGGAGFVGSHLCDELIRENHVICIDNFITSEFSNIELLVQNPNFAFIKHDLSQVIELEKYPELEKFQIKFQGIQEIYHLACPTSPKEYQKIPIETLIANSHATKNALDLAVKYKAKFLFISTAAIYGEPTAENQPFKEEYFGFVDPIGTRSAYIEGKRFAESLVVNYRNKFGIDAKILRLFNTYGPRMRLADGRMIPDFVASALENKPLIIYGDVNSTSTFCYISDVIDGLVKMMESQEAGPINLGHSDVYLVKDIADLVIHLIGSTSTIDFQSPLPHTARQGVPDISKAKEKLGWVPVVPIEDGLKKTIEILRASKVLKYP